MGKPTAFPVFVLFSVARVATHGSHLAYGLEMGVTHYATNQECRGAKPPAISPLPLWGRGWGGGTPQGACLFNTLTHYAMRIIIHIYYTRFHRILQAFSGFFCIRANFPLAIRAASCYNIVYDIKGGASRRTVYSS